MSLTAIQHLSCIPSSSICGSDSRGILLFASAAHRSADDLCRQGASHCRMIRPCLYSL